MIIIYLLLFCFFQSKQNDKTLEFGRDFRIKHYAGSVTYSVVGFIDKNKDTLFQDFKRLLHSRFLKNKSHSHVESLHYFTMHSQTIFNVYHFWETHTIEYG